MCECCGGDCKLSQGIYMDQDELLREYKKISNTFDDFTQAARKKVRSSEKCDQCDGPILTCKCQEWLNAPMGMKL